MIEIVYSASTRQAVFSLSTQYRTIKMLGSMYVTPSSHDLLTGSINSIVGAAILMLHGHGCGNVCVAANSLAAFSTASFFLDCIPRVEPAENTVCHLHTKKKRSVGRKRTQYSGRPAAVEAVDAKF